MALSPDNGFNFYNRGSVYLSMEKYTEALTPSPGHRAYASERNSWPCLLVQSEVGDIDKRKSPVDRRVNVSEILQLIEDT